MSNHRTLNIDIYESKLLKKLISLIPEKSDVDPLKVYVNYNNNGKYELLSHISFDGEFRHDVRSQYLTHDGKSVHFDSTLTRHHTGALINSLLTYNILNANPIKHYWEACLESVSGSPDFIISNTDNICLKLNDQFNHFVLGACNNTNLEGLDYHSELLVVENLEHYNINYIKIPEETMCYLAVLEKALSQKEKYFQELLGFDIKFKYQVFRKDKEWLDSPTFIFFGYELVNTPSTELYNVGFILAYNPLIGTELGFNNFKQSLSMLNK